jgi:hypothetical protein
MEQMLASQYVFQSPMRKFDTDYNFPDPSTRQEYYVFEVMSLDDSTFAALDSTGQITISSSGVYEVGDDAAERSGNDTRAEADLLATTATLQYSSLGSADTDYFSFTDPDDADADGVQIQVRPAYDSGSTGAPILEATPNWLKAYGNTAGNRVLRVRLTIEDDTGTAVTSTLESPRGVTVGSATSHELDLSYDTDEPYEAVFNRLTVPNFSGTYYLKIENISSTIGAVSGNVPTGNYMIDANDAGSGGRR